MSITRYPPNTVWLGGDRTQVNDRTAEEAITPGMLVELHNAAGVERYRKHATANGDTPFAVALDTPMLNKGVDDAYGVADLMEVGIGHKGSTFWMIIPSGQTIVAGDPLASNGDGKLKKWTTGTVLAIALEAKTATADTRIRVEAK